MAASASTRHRRNDSAQSTSTAYGPIPGSPTLTNPDMILPDYERSETPTDEHINASMLLWKGSQAGDLRFHMPLNNGLPLPSLAPTTPIIYGNGTMLSDIGEVTEVESNVGGLRNRASSLFSEHEAEDEPSQSTPTISAKNSERSISAGGRERRMSNESTSTVRSQKHKAAFADFDDTMSVGDSQFQGDDEQSLASSFVNDTILQPVATPTKGKDQTDKENLSTVSRRAEQILANAKKRLTNMEGNLTRARSSLSNSLASDGSTPSPPGIRPSTALQHSLASNSPVHWRNRSDDEVEGLQPAPKIIPRSASALGAAGGYRQPAGAKDSQRATRAQHKTPNHSLESTLEPLSEGDLDDGADNHALSPSYLYKQSLHSFHDRDVIRSASAAQMRDLQDQMQGLKGKISSLKEQARADSLKRRSLQNLRFPNPFTHARWDQDILEDESQAGDSRSQGTPDIAANSVPSIITSDVPEKRSHTLGSEAETRGAGMEEGRARQVVRGSHADSVEDARSTVKSSPRSGDRTILTPVEGDFRQNGSPIVNRNSDGAETAQSKRSVDPDEENDGKVRGEERGEQQQEDGEDQSEYSVRQAVDTGQHEESYSESGESLYEDTYQGPVSHEDREDAFDYEHFFLHSAMGSMRRRRRDEVESVVSESSEDSVVTTKGPRSDLERSTSTSSFATATEGRTSQSSQRRNSPDRTSERYDGDGYFDRYIGQAVGGEEKLVENGKGRYSRDGSERPSPTWRRQMYQPGGPHRPSISSFESTGTNRTFPLVTKAKLAMEESRSQVSSPDSQQLREITDTLMSDTASMTTVNPQGDMRSSSSMHMLASEDQEAVQKLVASLGKCVLGLSEMSRAGTEGRLLRRRLAAAQRILEGYEDPA